jgi:hypothetical protein
MLHAKIGRDLVDLFADQPDRVAGELEAIRTEIYFRTLLVEEKARVRAQCSPLIAAYLARGGQITRCTYVQSS